MFVQFGCVEDKALALLKWTGFLWRAHAQSGFKGALGEWNAITSCGYGHGGLSAKLSFWQLLHVSARVRGGNAAL